MKQVLYRTTYFVAPSLSIARHSMVSRSIVVLTRAKVLDLVSDGDTHLRVTAIIYVSMYPSFDIKLNAEVLLGH